MDTLIALLGWIILLLFIGIFLYIPFRGFVNLKKYLSGFTKRKKLIKALKLEYVGRGKYYKLAGQFGFNGKIVIRWKHGLLWIAAVSGFPLGTMRTDEFFDELDNSPIFDMYNYKPELNIQVQGWVNKDGDSLPSVKGESYAFYGIRIGAKETYDKEKAEELVKHTIKLTNYFIGR